MGRMKFTHFLATSIALTTLWLVSGSLGVENWTKPEKSRILELQLQSTVPPDPTNAVADNPQAALLGQKLFFDKRLSEDGQVSCATCHSPKKFFTDGKQLSEGIGMTTRNAPTVVGSAWNTWQFWDGRADSGWSQALGPLENSAEHGLTRSGVVDIIAKNYRLEYEEIFGIMPDLDDLYRFPSVASPHGNEDARRNWNQMSMADQKRVNRIFVNVGKAIAAFERRLKPGVSRFDRFAQGIRDKSISGILTNDEQAGLHLFIGKANCVSCHSGPQLSDQAFHNTGVPINTALPDDQGRSSVSKELSNLEFGCTSNYSDDRSQSVCKNFIATTSLPVRAFKTPSLRGVARTAPYTHDGNFKTLKSLLEHYNRAPVAPIGTSEVRPLSLSVTELAQLEAFLLSLDALIDAPADFLRDPIN